MESYHKLVYSECPNPVCKRADRDIVDGVFFCVSCRWWEACNFIRGDSLLS